MSDTVTVIIPAYNAAAHIHRAVESALTQTHPPIEILVIDDGSADRTADVAAAMPPPVRLIRKPNGGPASARNLGASQAQGTWLAFLDADDWWFPDKLRRQLILADEPDVGLIHCLPDHRNEVVPPELDFDQLWARNWIINSSVLARRTAFEQLGGFDEARELISVEDYHLWLRMAASSWRILTCPEVLVHYTRSIGLSSHTDRYMRAHLFSIADLGARLSLPSPVVSAKISETLFEFGRKALFERQLPSARTLFWQTFKRQPTARNALHLALSGLPASVLDIRRRATRMLRGPGDEERPAEPLQAAATPDLPAPAILALENSQVSILDSRFHLAAPESQLSQPLLVTTIDAEEDFDWSRPFSRAATDVTSMRSQFVAHRVFERYGVIPTYMVDHPVASQDKGRAPLKELLEAGHCDIGAQLHPWVTPPFIEHVSLRNSYPGNLPAALEYAKVETLTGELEAAFGMSPRIFRAGRYGVGPHTGGILSHFGYQADSSVMPCWNAAGEGGPDFRLVTAHPYWIGHGRTILELPVSAALVGRASTLPPRLTSRLFGRSSEVIGLPSVMAHLGMLERIKLTPEGIRIEEAKRLVRHMVTGGHKVFVLTYHSPSLEPGNTPYVRTSDDLDRFLRWLDAFYDFFTTEIGGRCVSWQAVRTALMTGERAR